MTNPTLLAPTLAPGVTLLGEYQGSGFTEPHYLIVRADQQVLHVSRLLFVVASHLDGRSSMEEIAARVSQEYGRTLDAEGVEFLVTAKLRPMGIVADSLADDTGEHARSGFPSRPPPPAAPRAGSAGTRPAPEPREAPLPAPPAPTRLPLASLPRANPLLALRFRGTLIPAPATRFLARLLAPFFYATGRRRSGILGLVVADVWLFRQASLTGAVDSILVDPPMLLLRDRDPARRHGRPRARPRGRLPLRRRHARKDRRRGLHRLPRLLHRRHPVLPARSRRPGPHRPRRRLLQRADDRRADGGVCAHAFAGGPARHRLRPRRGAAAAASARSPRRLLRRRRPRRRARPVRPHRPDPAQRRPRASDPPEGRRAAPLGARSSSPSGCVVTGPIMAGLAFMLWNAPSITIRWSTR